MNINQINSHNQVQNSQNVKTLAEGSQVGVKILASLGNNKYSASVAGVRTTITANNGLKPGSFFAGIVRSNGGQINIVPLNLEAMTNGLDKVKVLSFENGINTSDNALSFISNPQISSLLQSLGLVANNLSFSIFQQMKQLGLKMDSAIMGKIYKMAIKFTGHEKEAAELLVLMNQKGIELSEDEIRELLGLLEGETEENRGDRSPNKQNKGNHQKELKKGTGLSIQKSELNIEQISSMVKVFIESISSEQMNNREIGVLTLMNHLGWKKDGSGNGSWIFLPFEIVENQSTDGKVFGNGNIRLFLNQTKKLDFMMLNCIYNGKEFDFRIQQQNKKLNIDMCVSGDENNQIEPERCMQDLKKAFSGELGEESDKIQDVAVEINFVEKEKFKNFGSGFETVDFIGGEI